MTFNFRFYMKFCENYQWVGKEFRLPQFHSLKMLCIIMDVNY